MKNEFKVFKEIGPLRLCTVTRIVGVDEKTNELKIEHVSYNTELAIEYQLDNNYIVVTFIREGKLIDVDNRYFDYIRSNKLETEFEDLVESSTRIKHGVYIKTPEEAEKAILEYIQNIEE